MEIEELSEQIGIILNRFYLKSRRISIIGGQATLFAVEDFGLMICCIHRLNYGQASTILEDHYGDWRHHYVSTDESLMDKRLDILWDLMRCGYMKWLRTNYPRQIRNVLIQDNLGKRIIEERLRIWNNRTKFRFLIEDNKAALRNNMLSELTQDNGFFDYMPEEV